MLDGHTLDDLIYGIGEYLLTKDEVVAYVHGADPNYQGWDDWPLQMTVTIRDGMIGPCKWLIVLIRFSGPMVPILS